jgi:hypothetical protein
MRKFLPYARAGVDETGHFVTCPVCGEKFRGIDESYSTLEDAETKGAVRLYAEHYNKEHE